MNNYFWDCNYLPEYRKIFSQNAIPLLGTISNLHIKNTSDLLNKINNINIENKYLASIDIKSLYTNIPVKNVSNV